MNGRLALIALLMTTAGLAGCTTPGNDPGNNDDGTTPEPSICSDDVLLKENVQVILETTLGSMTIELFADKAPTTASNFAANARDGNYDGAPFHRIITDFMMQGGDFTMGNGRGGLAHPSCDADGNGKIPDEFHEDLRHSKKGMLSMANAGPNSGGSQFFIIFAPTSWLDDKHAVFGEVVDGLDVLDRVNEEAGSQSGTPATEVTLISATVIE